MGKVLFVGGTGNISLPCVHEALAAGHEVAVFNRGQREELPGAVRQITGSLDDDAAYAALGAEDWDVVAQFMTFLPERMARDIEVFSGRAGQLVFISSASVYLNSCFETVITEETPRENPYWLYSRNKIACEDLLMAQDALPYTIVRPSHTIRTWVPTLVGEPILRRMAAGKPLLVSGDGNAPWTLTRSEDFARPFVRLFGNAAALGEDVHITGPAGFTWDAIYRTIAAGFGHEPEIVHVATDTCLRFAPEWEGPLRGDKSWTALFDNAKLRGIVGETPFETDLEKVLEGPIAWTKAHPAEPNAEAEKADAQIDMIIAAVRGLGV